MTDQPNGVKVSPWWKESVAPVLAILIVVGGFLVICYKPEAKTEIVALMVMVIGFYFGSSKSSQSKDETISTQLAVKDDTIKEQLEKKP